MNKKMLELLYRSFDDVLTPEEQRQLGEALAKSKELQKEKERIAKLRTTISDSAAQSFKPFFAEKVVRRIREKESVQEAFVDSLFHVFRPVAIAIAMLLITLMSYNLIKSDNISLASTFVEPEVSLEQVLEPSLPFAME